MTVTSINVAKKIIAICQLKGGAGRKQGADGSSGVGARSQAYYGVKHGDEEKTSY